MIRNTAEILDSGTAFLELTEAPAVVPVVPDQSIKSKRLAAAKRQRLYNRGYTLGIVLLMLVCGAECLYRLVWSMQP